MLKGWEWANPVRWGAESSYPRTVVNWLCDIRTRARDNLHADVPCQRLESQLLRRCAGKSGLFLTLHWLIPSSQWQRGPRQMWPRVHTDGPLLVFCFFFFLFGFDLFRPSTFMKFGKCSEASLALEQWVWNKPPPSHQKCCLGDSGAPLFQIIKLLQR